MNLDLIRKTQYELLFHHASFLWVRYRALGSGEREAKKAILRFLRTALDRDGGEKIQKRLEIQTNPTEYGVEARLHYRYPLLLSFPWRGQTKHHFEVTKTCTFPF